MEWRSVSFDWNRARAFLVTAEEGSLSAAARALGTTQPTLGRQVAALEKELGVALFQRVGRGLALTPSGLELVEHVRAMGAAASGLSLAASGQSQAIEGLVCVTAGHMISAYRLPAIVAKLGDIAPGVDIEIVASNAITDLRRREADIAVRHVAPNQPDLIAKKIKETPAWLYATPGYLKALGDPRRAEDLTRATFIGADQSDRMAEVLNGLGLSLTRANFRFVSENSVVGWELVKAGLGIGVMPADLAEREPAVQRVPAPIDPIIVPLWLTTHRELRTSRRIRLVYDLLAAELAKD
ncbi:MAG: LysR family transcriptional regulator [Caulobacterales bacterium]|nr:LysR family transcriptional regulator [Caulobacterales bacterium]